MTECPVKNLIIFSFLYIEIISKKFNFFHMVFVYSLALNYIVENIKQFDLNVQYVWLYRLGSKGMEVKFGNGYS